MTTPARASGLRPFDLASLRRVTVYAGFATYGMIVLGALIRTTDSGLSCPDWPTCYGEWVLTPAEFRALGDTGYTYLQVFYEWIHRAIAAGIIGPFMLLIGWMCWRNRAERAGLPSLGAALVVLLAVQGSLGGVTVLDSNSPWSVAAHLGTALVILSTLLLIFTRAGRPVAEGASPLLTGVAVATFATALVTMLSAAMTAKSGASLACATWPDCNGALIPEGLATDEGLRLHFAHRSLAALTGVLVLALFLLTRGGGTPFGRLGSIALGLVVTQVSLGAIVIWLWVPVWAGVLHQAVGVALFVTLTLGMWRCVLAPRTVTARLTAQPA